MHNTHLWIFGILGVVCTLQSKDNHKQDKKIAKNIVKTMPDLLKFIYKDGEYQPNLKTDTINQRQSFGKTGANAICPYKTASNLWFGWYIRFVGATCLVFGVMVYC